jgi:hypothetical protein
MRKGERTFSEKTMVTFPAELHNGKFIDYRVDRCDMESRGRLHCPYGRLHELLCHADGRTP